MMKLNIPGILTSGTGRLIQDLSQDRVSHVIFSAKKKKHIIRSIIIIIICK